MRRIHGVWAQYRGMFSRMHSDLSLGVGALLVPDERNALGENARCQAQSLARLCLRATFHAGRGCNHGNRGLTLDAPTRRSIE
jgi:hypothetical protein